MKTDVFNENVYASVKKFYKLLEKEYNFAIQIIFIFQFILSDLIFFSYQFASINRSQDY